PSRGLRHGLCTRRGGLLISASSVAQGCAPRRVSWRLNTGRDRTFNLWTLPAASAPRRVEARGKDPTARQGKEEKKGETTCQTVKLVGATPTRASALYPILLWRTSTSAARFCPRGSRNSAQVSAWNMNSWLLAAGHRRSA